MEYRKNVLKFYGLPLLILFVLTGATSEKKKSTDNKPNIEEKNISSKSNLTVSKSENLSPWNINIEKKYNCKKNFVEMKPELALSERINIFEKESSNSREQNIRKAVCSFNLLGIEATSEQAKTIFVIMIKNKDFSDANELISNYNFRDYAISTYLKLAKESLDEYKNDKTKDAPYRLATEFTKQAKK